jgi:ATP-dependent Lhr-like helicase
VEAKEGVRYLIYLAGGTIPDRGYYTLRIQDSKAKIGELDEEFVWERSVGETFTLGNQTWRIQKIDHKDVEVLPAGDPSNLTPFWKAERRNRDFYLSEKISAFLEEWNGKLDRSNSMDELQTRYSIDTTSAGELLSFLRRQKKNTGTDLPHRYHLLIEHFKDAGGRKGMEQVVLHTLWGGKVNQPFAVALSQAWEDKYNFTLEVPPRRLRLYLAHEPG